MTDLAAEIAAVPEQAEAVLCRRLAEPDVMQLLLAAPGGSDQAARGILSEIRNFRTHGCDLPELVQTCLLAQVDAVWWGTAPAFQTDADVDRSDDLVDVTGAAFRYRLQTDSVARRALRSLARQLAPDHSPDPVGLRFARTRPEVLALLGELSAEFARLGPAGLPPLWVTSLTRSVRHQFRLRSLGYTAMLPSSHCTGYAADIAMSWYRRCGADGLLRELLLDRCQAGLVNVIRGESTWHVCLSPSGVSELRLVAE